MKVSAKTQNACIALLELAKRYESGEPVRIRAIADEHEISERFLVQILLQLKGANLVNSTRGASGGYQLSRRPEEVTLLEVVRLIEGEPAQPHSAQPGLETVLREVWQEITAAEEEILEATTLATLLERARTPTQNMYYI